MGTPSRISSAVGPIVSAATARRRPIGSGAPFVVYRAVHSLVRLGPEQDGESAHDNPAFPTSGDRFEARRKCQAVRQIGQSGASTVSKCSIHANTDRRVGALRPGAR